ncbi:RHS repeat-associated core domain-containing protein [Pseudomonas caspiana]|uniref:RHS repeat domain-containing protein n=1 Tax=Pseudomonas caspiana TaxID=1451454 RepID=UPI0032EAFF1A
MPGTDFSMHRHTPVISVQDPRGLTVRGLQFYRRAIGDAVEVCVAQQVFDVVGRPVVRRDARLFSLFEADSDVPANLSQTFSLGGALLSSDSVDAGWRVSLSGEAGQMLEGWDERETHSVMQYDALLRPLAIIEQDQAIERFTYAPADAQAVAHNMCGRLARHDDPAGSQLLEEYSIGAALLQTTRRFLQVIERPDWPVSEAARNELLEPVPGAVTRYACNPWAEAIGQTDAQGNVQRLEVTCAGALRSTHVQLAGQAEQVLVSDIRYNAFGQVESETAGNEVRSITAYDPASGLLKRLTARKATGATLQDLNYEHDPLGNILRIEDAAQPTRYFRNQAVADVSTYRYDTLYQLIEATGREALDADSGPPLALFQSPADPNQLAHYTQHYAYDAGGNLRTLSHVGAQSCTRQMIIARYSNRSLPVVGDHVPDEKELEAAFDANGNLLELQRGQLLAWDVRNQLQQVTPVQREEAEDDCEVYCYDGNGQRVRKVRITQAANTTHRAEVRYLPGLELRTDTATGESLQVINAPAGRCDVRVLHWLEDSNPEGIANNQVRYSLSDHLGSSTLELDDRANVISQERYYPFGGTSWWAGRSAVEAKYKTIRYSGQERDATGLYYYGMRYYAPWLCRWINPDPAGVAAGMNLYQMVVNNPIGHVDSQGLAPVELDDKLKALAQQTAVRLFQSGEALISSLRPYEESKTLDWMFDEIKDLKRSRIKYAEAVWTYAKTHFFGHEESLANDRRAMTKDLKAGLNLFWSTNAGARYINSATRSVTSERAAGLPSFEDAKAAAGQELSKNNGEHTVRLNHVRKNEQFVPALKMLGKYQAYPAGIMSLFTASLGKPINEVLYRGARIAREEIDAFKEGLKLTTSGFTAFTPDKETAKTFLEKYHDPAVIKATAPVLFILHGGALKVKSPTEVEGLILPKTHFSIVATERKRGYLNVTIVPRKTGNTGMWI